jgi:hypothetical protein
VVWALKYRIVCLGMFLVLGLEESVGRVLIQVQVQFQVQDTLRCDGLKLIREVHRPSHCSMSIEYYTIYQCMCPLPCPALPSNSGFNQATVAPRCSMIGCAEDKTGKLCQILSRLRVPEEFT